MRPFEQDIRLCNVVKRFGALEVLKGIDLTFAAGKTTVLVGPSGSGKSTLVRCLNRLEPIQDGNICLAGVTITRAGVERNGKRLSAREVARFRRGVGMVFQSFNLFPHLSVLGNIIEAPVGVLGWSRKDAVDRAMNLLKEVNLCDKADAYPANLSGGQQQRVAIVRSLILDPGIMLFDEPTSALDPELTSEVLRVIRDLAIGGRTSVLVTHEMRFAREVADHVVFMDGGKVIEQGSAQQVLSEPREIRTRRFLQQVVL